MDVKRGLFGKYRVFGEGGRKTSEQDPVSWAIQMEKAGAGEILLTAMDRDGLMEGYDTVLLRKVTAAVHIPVIACGGAGRLQDFRAAVIEGGASAVAAGSMVVYQGRNKGVLINFPQQDDLKQLFD